MANYDLYRFLREELRNGSSDLVTRPSGKVMRERIEKEIVKEEEGTVVALDFSNIGIVDYSCADEIIAKLLSRLLSDEYGEKYMILAGLNEHQKENIEVALERKSLAVGARMRDGKGAMLGILNNYLKVTLEFIEGKDKITAKDLSETTKLEANTSCTRLLNLYRKRLVKRREEIRSGGRVWVYERLDNMV